MSRYALSFLFLLAVLGNTAARAGGELKPWTGGTTPPLSLRDLAGQPVSLTDFKGKVVLVNFWATWCAPCIEEMPSLQRMQDRLALAGFEVLAVNYQESQARINGFLKKRPLSLTILLDHDGSVRTAWGVRVFPTSFVLDTSQRIRYTAVGEVDWESPSMVTQIRGLLPKS